MHLNQDIQSKIERLKSYQGQLIDLKSGYLKELALTKENDEAIDLLLEVIGDAVKNAENFLKMDAYMSEQYTLELEREEEARKRQTESSGKEQ